MDSGDNFARSGPPSYDLADLGLFADAGAGSFQTLVSFAVDLVQPDIALVTMIDDRRGRQVFKAHHGLPPEIAAAGEASLDRSICRLVRDQAREMHVSDAAAAPDPAAAAALAALGAQSYAGVPVFGPDEEPVGTVAAMCHGPRLWSRRDIEALRRVGRIASDLVMLRACKTTLRLVALERG